MINKMKIKDNKLLCNILDFLAIGIIFIAFLFTIAFFCYKDDEAIFTTIKADTLNGYYIIVDNETGLEYIMIKEDSYKSSSVSITPRLDENGNHIMNENWRKSRNE